MTTITRTNVTVVLVALLVFRVFSVPAHACLPFEYSPSVIESTDLADIVVVGAVAGSSQDPLDVFNSYDTTHWAVYVEIYLEGSGPNVLLTTGYGSGHGDCLNPPPGDRSILFLESDPKSDTILSASYEEVYAAVWDATDSNI